MTPQLVVLAAGPAVTIQDHGRPGLAHLGLPASGPMDPLAQHLANALVGNAPGEAAIEIGPGGLVLRIEGGTMRIAIAGAEVPLAVDGTPARPWRSLTLPAGSTVAAGTARVGVWAYVAVAGGLALPASLGSRSTHVRAGIGGLVGRRLVAGDVLPLAGGPTAPAGADLVLADPPLPSADEPIRVVLGPQAERVTEGSRSLFLETVWRVDPAIDRMAYRLEGPRLAHAGPVDIVSDAIVPGSVQIPGSGRPIVMMRDHQTTGGYPKLATVIGPDLRTLAQRQPGVTVRFAVIDLAEADRARADTAGVRAGALARIAPLDGGLDARRLLRLNLIGGVIDATMR